MSDYLKNFQETAEQSFDVLNSDSESQISLDQILHITF